MENNKYELEITGGTLNVRPIKMIVSQDVIDFLNLHDKRVDNTGEYFLINRIEYKLNGIVRKQRIGTIKNNES